MRGIAAHRLDAVLAEEFREHPQHGFSVLKHVADTGRYAGIVFENKELVFPVRTGTIPTICV